MGMHFVTWLAVGTRKKRVVVRIGWICIALGAAISPLELVHLQLWRPPSLLQSPPLPLARGAQLVSLPAGHIGAAGTTISMGA